MIWSGFQKGKRAAQLLIFPISFFLFFASAGWAAYAFSDPRSNSDWFGNSLDSNAAWLVRLDEDPRPGANSIRAKARVIARFDSVRRSVSGNVLLYFSKNTDSIPVSGDTLLIAGNWMPVRNSSNPFAFDNQAFQARKGIFHQQFISGKSFNRAGWIRPSERTLLDRVHAWCSLQLSTYIHDSASLGLLQAMILGDEHALDPELRTVYSETGVVHIVSISGAHVAMLFLVVTSLLHWIRGRKGAWIRYAVGLLLVWWYVLMAGAPPSALRSAVMFSVVALSALSKMQGQSLNTLFSAALILLIGNPAWLFSVGFQLSFLAVLSMLLFYQPLYALWPFRSWHLDKPGKALSASLAAEILTAPLVVYYFHNFPLFFLLANLLAGVLVGTVALIGGMIIIAVSGVPVVAEKVALFLSYCVQFFNAAMNVLQSWTPKMFRYLRIDLPELLLLYLIIATISVFFLRKERRALWLTMPSMLLLLILLSKDAWNANRQDRLIVYENGRTPLVERVRGNSFEILIGSRQESFNSKAAHIGWHAWQPYRDSTSSFFRMNGNRILVFSESMKMVNAPPLPVDILIWARNGKRIEFENVLNSFQPKTLVLAQRSSNYERSGWVKACAKRGIRLWETARDGAFLLD